MKNYGRQRSTVKPQEVEVTETKVFVASNIVPVSEDYGDMQRFEGWEFNLAEYDKNEYISTIEQRTRNEFASMLSLMPLEIQAAMIENDTNNILNSLESEVTK